MRRVWRPRGSSEKRDLKQQCSRAALRPGNQRIPSNPLKLWPYQLDIKSVPAQVVFSLSFAEARIRRLLFPRGRGPWIFVERAWPAVAIRGMDGGGPAAY